MTFKRIKEKEDGTISEKEVYNKVLILKEESLYTVDTYTYMYELLIKLLDNIDLDKDIKDYLRKYISAINNLKALKISNLEYLDLEEYKEKIDTISKDLYKMNLNDNVQYKLLEASLFEDENEYDEFLKENKDNAEEWIGILQAKIDSYNFGLEFALSESLYKENEHEIIVFIEKVTGDFYMDLILKYKELLNNYRNIPKDKDLISGHTFLEFSTYNYHFEIIVLMNKILMDTMYLLNSTSFIRNKLCDFDIFKLKGNFDYFPDFLSRSYDVFEYQYTN